jgi:hypothetical protein
VTVCVISGPASVENLGKQLNRNCRGFPAIEHHVHNVYARASVETLLCSSTQLRRARASPSNTRLHADGPNRKTTHVVTQTALLWFCILTLWRVAGRARDGSQYS